MAENHGRGKPKIRELPLNRGLQLSEITIEVRNGFFFLMKTSFASPKIRLFYPINILTPVDKKPNVCELKTLQDNILQGLWINV